MLSGDDLQNSMEEGRAGVEGTVGGGYKWDKIGHEQTIVEAGWWAHGGLMY